MGEKSSRARPSRRKTAPKTALRVPSHGKGLLLAGGKPGNSGGTGRPPDEFKQLCQRLASRDETIKAVEEILKDQDHPAYLGALKWATENGYGRPKESVEHSGTIDHKHQVWQFGNRKVAF